MPKVTYDSDVFMKRKPQSLPQSFYMSAVVLEELAAGARDGSVLKELGAALKNYQQAGRLLVPTAEDWYLAGKVIYALQQGAKSKKTGDKPPLPPEIRCRIINDVLIARTAKRSNATVITKNISDFERIKRFCAVKVAHPDNFFIS